MHKWILILLFFIGTNVIAQDALSLVQKVKAKLDLVKDYTATGRLKTDVAFL